MELYPAPRLTPAAPAGAAGRCERYLARLPIPEARRQALLHAVGEADGQAAMAALHRALGGRGDAAAPAAASLGERLALACGPSAGARRAQAHTGEGRVRLLSTPPIRRTPMAPRPWPLPLGLRGSGSRDPAFRQRRRAGSWRRATLAALTCGLTGAATWAMTAVLPYHGDKPMEKLILALFAVLIFWVAAGFWTAIMGLALLLSGHDPHAITASAGGDAPIGPAARTAVVMPICNESVDRVFAGLHATYESLARSGELAHFDFFVLSDSSEPDLRVAETEAWLALCRSVDGFGHIFYRWRRNRIKRKSGNIADFCRRWGGDYRYMVILDADSVMSGDCLATLVRRMEANPDAGIIQTAPCAAGRETLHARIQQFASRVYGPLFTAGLHFWQLGEAHYWGHNAIIRVAPFIRHCALGRLPRRGGGSQEILSHDFVEAALMRRAGWGVWIAYDLPGSYEELPPNLLDELKRDRRWCQGNLINSRLFLADGVHAAHRAVFATGVMAYLSAPLWFLFLLMATALLAIHTLVPPRYFIHPYQLFPIWPEWSVEGATMLFGATAALLIAPKFLAALFAALRGAARFGGVPRLLFSTLAEIAYSMLLAPIRMLFHTQFVAAALAGWHAAWKSPPREDAETGWGEACRRHGWHTLLGAAWAGAVHWLNPSYLPWLLPVVGALLLAIPLSVFSSRVAPGRCLRRARLFLVPEESRPPPELRRLRLAQRCAPVAAGFVAAVVDPLANAVACAAGGGRSREGREPLLAAALAGGPQALAARQKLELLDDPQALSSLHFAVWTADAPHPEWLRAMGPRACGGAGC